MRKVKVPAKATENTTLLITKLLDETFRFDVRGFSKMELVGLGEVLKNKALESIKLRDTEPK